MKAQPAFDTVRRFTFKGNQKHTRYGWLRLTPAYSVHLVSELLEKHKESDAAILDPFCGTGTTALACAERGLACDTTDINPFLIWLAEVKTREYSKDDLNFARSSSMLVAKAMREGQPTSWLPPLYQIEKWWEPGSLAALGRGMQTINSLSKDIPVPSVDLLKTAFCRVAIEHAHVSFGHQSMSFKKPDKVQKLGFGSAQQENVAAGWEHSVASILDAAATPISRQPRAVFCDARELTTKLAENAYSYVVTSPPYPNRMSYIRELRPYLYWLGYLTDQREAGELDWAAIGGTWGCATSNVGKWNPPSDVEIPFPRFQKILAGVAKRSTLLSKYIHKYFYDMVHHCDELFRVVRPRGTVNYIVGNSKFYDVMLPVEQIYAGMFEAAGFKNIEIRTIRKRTSKKELYEFVVSAQKPSK